MVDTVSFYGILKINKLTIDPRAQKWCALPYPGHKHGCPNYDSGRLDCPPNAPLVSNYFDLTQPHWFVVVKFDMAQHMKKLLIKHPDWSQRQLRCVLYWQNSVRKVLNQYCEEFCKNRDRVYELIPEAMGVHVIRSAKNLGIPIKTKPTDTIFKIALVGYRKFNEE